MPRTGRPKKEFDKKQFEKLIGIGCGEAEIRWWFRDENGKNANLDTLSRWCKREYGMTFQEYRRQNGAMFLKIQLRDNQLALSKKSAAMAIFLGKNYLGQSDVVVQEQKNSAANDQIIALASLINNPVPDVDIAAIDVDAELEKQQQPTTEGDTE